MAERLIPVMLPGPDLVPWLADADVQETSPGPAFRQVPVCAPEGRDPRADGLGTLLLVLAQFEYKPRWRFVLTWTGYEGRYMNQWVIHVHTWVENAYHPGVWAEGHSLAAIPVGSKFNEAGWLSFLHGYVIPRIEQHETDEWFRYKGERPYDPHKPRGSGTANTTVSGAAGGPGGGGRGGSGGVGGNAVGAAGGGGGGRGGGGVYHGSSGAVVSTPGGQGGGASSSQAAWRPGPRS